MKYKIAYIDEDSGWINTFYHTFKEDFYILKIEVSSESSIDSIIDTLLTSDINAIVTDYLLEENAEVPFNGNKIVEVINQVRPHFPIVMLTSHPTQAISQTDDVHIIYSKELLTVESDKDREELELFIIKVNPIYLTTTRKLKTQIVELNNS